MSDFTSVNAGAMSQAVGDLKQAHSKVESDLTELEHNLESSLQQWTGDAREAYRAAKAQWDAAADHMNQVIVAMQGAMQNIGDNYDSTERAVSTQW